MTALQFLARELRRARETAGMSQAELAAAITCYSSSLVAMVETCRRIPKPDFAERCDQVLSTGGILSRLLEDLVSSGMPSEWQGKWLDIEARATSLYSYEPLIVPGLLQTEAYARAVIAMSGRRFDVDEQVEARLERQRILAADMPPMLVAVMDEGVLHRPVGGTEVMSDQLMHLLDMAERHDIVIQIVPLAVGAYAGLAGPFVVAEFEGGEAAYIDNALAGDVVERYEEVLLMKRLWAALRGEALSRKQSLELIEKAVSGWVR
ncbi:helix-turn-helix transcriptional regulator [Thermopolyspora sp. NPDC052614]|uniref:helix-turn-helix domain-containing protein n=1 Tax=Thermopolyspora sp. NPDC052614 TaxID=3155682 RepID=UPI003441C4E5